MRRNAMTMENPWLSIPQRSNTGCEFLSLLPCYHTTGTDGLRRMERLEKHYVALGIELLFKSHPKLEEYLRERYDDKLVSEVCSSSRNFPSLVN
jgi:hypothetical protein